MGLPEACLMIKETEEREEEEKDQEVEYTCVPFTLMQWKPSAVVGCNAKQSVTHLKKTKKVNSEELVK